MPPPCSLPCCPRRTSTPSATGFPSHSPQLTLIRLHPRCPGKIRRLSVPCKFRPFSKNSIASTANQQNQCPQAIALPQTQAVVVPADSTSQCTVGVSQPSPLRPAPLPASCLRPPTPVRVFCSPPQTAAMLEIVSISPASTTVLSGEGLQPPCTVPSRSRRRAPALHTRRAPYPGG